MLFNDCPPELATWATGMLRPEPVQLPVPPDVPLTDENFGRVPRAYIECVHDNAITVGQQRRMQELLPCDRVYRLASSHAPFLSRPDELADCLLDAATLS